MLLETWGLDADGHVALVVEVTARTKSHGRLTVGDGDGDGDGNGTALLSPRVAVQLGRDLIEAAMALLDDPTPPTPQSRTTGGAR